MNLPRPHGDIVELLGVYALDMLDIEEREVVDGHLAGCRACADEVAEHWEAAGLLTTGGPPPPVIWNRITAALEEAPPPLELAPVVALRRRASRTNRFLAGMTAVAAAVAVFLSVRLVDQEHRLAQMEAATADDGLRQSAIAALANPASQTLQLRSADRPVVAQAAILPDGRGYLLVDQLSGLRPDRSYQLWVLVDNERVSAGILGSRPTVAAFHVGQRLDGLAITEERAGGVVVSENAPVVFGRLTSS
jgi:hypothetical protein